MLDFVQKKKIYLLKPMQRIPFHLKSKIILALFSKVLSPLKHFLKKEPQSNSNICYKLHLTHRVKSWHFYFRIWHYTDSDMITVCLGEKRCKMAVQKNKTNTPPTKIKQSNYAEKHQCQRGSLPSSWNETALFPNQS